MTETGVSDWRRVTVPFTVSRPDPLPGHLAPLDRRHRWMWQRRDSTGDWYRCRVCRRRRRVLDLHTMLTRKMRDAAHSLDEYLAETLWR